MNLLIMLAGLTRELFDHAEGQDSPRKRSLPRLDVVEVAVVVVVVVHNSFVSLNQSSVDILFKTQ